MVDPSFDSNPLFTVVICTYQPRIDLLKKVITAINKQTIHPSAIHSISIVDNGSTPPIKESDFPSELPINLKRYETANLGLARANIAQSLTTPWIIWVDDDVLLDETFASTAKVILSKHNHLGVFSGTLSPFFESPQNQEIAAYLDEMAIRGPSRPCWSNLPSSREATPVGAAMICKTEVAKEWASQFLNSDRPQLGRVGDNRAGSEDIDLAWFACEMGFSMGVFPELKAMHHIDPSRMTASSLKKLIYDKSVSIGLRNATWAHRLEHLWIPPPPTPLRKAIWGLRDEGLRAGKKQFHEFISQELPQLPKDRRLSLSVVVATCNPDKGKWDSLMKALTNQSLEPVDWELIIVENGSSISPPIPDFLNSNVSLLPEAHLYRARQYGWQSTRSDVVVFFDDDCVPDTSYLENALRIAQAYPSIGAWGGSYKRSINNKLPAFPAEWTDPITDRIVNEVNISKDLKVEDGVPYGLGLCMRREVLDRIDFRLRCFPQLYHLGRQKDLHNSHEDLDMAFTAISLGYFTGVFPQLHSLHNSELSHWSAEDLYKYWKDWATSATIFHSSWGQKVEDEIKFLLKPPTLLSSLKNRAHFRIKKQIQNSLVRGIEIGHEILGYNELN